MCKLVNLCLIFFITLQTFAQDITGDIRLSALSSSTVTPFYLHSNQYGKYGYNGGFEGIAEGKCFLTFEKNKFTFEAGLDRIAKNDLSDSYLHQSFLNINYGAFELKLGKEEFWGSLLDEELSSGAFLFGNNYRPVPRIGIGIYEFTPVPWGKGHWEVKGFLHHGLLNDDRGERGKSDVQLHEKQAYLRYAKGKIKPYVGLNHLALLGGTASDGTKTKVDYFASLLGMGSAKLGGGEETNVAGAHTGFEDFGVDIELENWNVKLYYQNPFSDGSGMHFWKIKSRDKIVGLQLRSMDKNIISGFSYEYFKTDYQSGVGTPDHLIDGRIISKKDRERMDLTYPEFIYKYFSDAYPGMSFDEFMEIHSDMRYEEFDQIISDQVNEGHHAGGRDDYYNNGSYNAGNSYNGRSMGTPYFFSMDQMNVFNPDFHSEHDRLFVNNRVVAHFIALNGWLRSNLSYNIKYSHTANYGTYTGKYRGRYNWDLDEDYFFTNGLKENFLKIAVQYVPGFCEGCTLGIMYGTDWGEIYESSGIGVKLSYRFVSP